MAKKKLSGNGIYFTGQSSNEVTGSQYFIKFGDSNILIECGLYQSSKNDYLDSYKINSEKFKFKPCELDFVFVCHTHIDHIGLLPRLVKEGFNGRIITTSDTFKLMKPLLLNSCAILQEEARILSKKYKRNYAPLYNEEDIYKTLTLVRTYDEYNTEYYINENIKFQWLKNSHCLGAAQLYLTLTEKNITKKILYTSDMGSLRLKNHYVDQTEIPTYFADIAIMESTYGSSKKKTNKKRTYDVKHLKTAIETTLDQKGTVILPCFSFSRTQELLTVLYEMFGDDSEFITKIYIDSKLSCEICELYSHILIGDNLEKWSKVLNWSNVNLIKEKTISKEIIFDKTPKIVISSSGFCTNGRVVSYLKRYIKDFNSIIIFSGYAGDNPSYLSYRIKNYKDNRTIKINGEILPNNANCITLSTFSSHASNEDLIEYGSSLNTNKLILVHGSKQSKNELANDLKQAISKNNNTYGVIPSFKNMFVKL